MAASAGRLTGGDDAALPLVEDGLRVGPLPPNATVSAGMGQVGHHLLLVGAGSSQ